VRRIDAPVLTDLELAIDPALGVRELLPVGGHLPDLYDVEPLVLIGRFDRAARGTITLRGRTGAGAWERTISVTLPEREPQHDVVPTLWARAKVDELLLPKLAAVEQDSLDAPTQRSVIRLGEAFHITTPYTSFVAVEKSRVVVGGKPMLVSVPVELPSGTNWNGFFGEGAGVADVMAAEARGARRPAGAVESFGHDLSRIAAGGQPSGRVDESRRELAARQQGDAMNSAPTVAAAPAPAAAVSSRPSAPPPPTAPGASIKPRGAQHREILPHGGATGAIEGRRSAEAGEKSKASQGQFGGIPGKRAPGGSQLAPPRQSTGGGVGSAGGGGVADSAARMPATAASAPAAAGADATGASVTDAAASDASGQPDPKASLLDAATRDTLVRVLDRRLLILALASVLGEGARIPELASELDLELEDGMILVAMKVETTGGKPAASALAALRAAGGVASAEDGARGLVVARVPATGLAALAKGAGVRRIEVLTPSEVPQG
jgi:hypothetical protein